MFDPWRGDTTTSNPLLVMLHGAGGRAISALSIVRAEAQRRRVVVVAPKSSSVSWDVLRGGFGPDVATIDQALEHAFSYHTIDARRVAIGGFSDGASYALTLGILNGDLFRNILAFSPGFTAANTAIGRPKIYISHGQADTILPYEQTGEPLARQLEKARYDVRFDAFKGGHKVPPDKVSSAMDWWLDN